ncbi:MAG: hypothetical protein WA678_06935 [Rhabdochlamydiaceae bacterium]|jgi:hypothetical protein
MKHSLSKVLFMVLICFCVNCSADCHCSHAEIRFVACPKTYVNAEQIAFYENGIFVQIDDFTLQTESLSTDAQGIFFENVKDGCGPSQWRCKRPDANEIPCNTCNWDWNITCTRCKWER